MNTTIPLNEKFNLSLNEAATYFSIGRNKILELIRDDPHFMTCVLNVGKGKRLINRAKAEKYFSERNYI